MFTQLPASVAQWHKPLGCSAQGLLVRQAQAVRSSNVGVGGLLVHSG